MHRKFVENRFGDGVGGGGGTVGRAEGIWDGGVDEPVGGPALCGFITSIDLMMCEGYKTCSYFCCDSNNEE